MTCHDVEQQLPSYVDGTTTRPEAQVIASHLETCDDCRASWHAQTVARTVLKARAAELSPIAPPGLRTRLRAAMDDERASAGQVSAPSLAWTGRVTAFAAASMVVLTLGAILLPAVTIRSTAVLAAQLALDHLKCFTIEGDADSEPIASEAAESTLKTEFDLTVRVPASLPGEQLELLAVRRCLYGDGRAAHLMYRLNGAPVSLFIVPGMARPADELSLFGHDQLVWSHGDRTYMLVARGGSRADLARVASYLQNEAK
ncbi:MAG TPA: zf-HC2 domain-containing protein [Vicinamibacterales bacterium]|jgi:anti-sigma factor RsiW